MWGRFAIYGLGTFARLLTQAGNDKESTRLVGLLTSRLPPAQAITRKVDLLLGISNSGSSTALDAVIPLTDDPDEQVRSAAITALRLIDHSGVDEILVSHMTSDSAKRVRLAALGAFSRRSPTDRTVSALQGVALGDREHAVRLEAVRLMARWMPTMPSLRATLEQVARADSEKTVRETAAASSGSR
jgi:HEAT repeat protein